MFQRYLRSINVWLLIDIYIKDICIYKIKIKPVVKPNFNTLKRAVKSFYHKYTFNMHSEEINLI